MNHAVSSRPINRRTLVGGSLASAISLAASTGLAGCSGSGSVDPAGSSPVDRDHTVTIAMNAGSEPAAGFDPLVAWGCGEHVHEPLIQSTLVTTNDQMEIVGDLATNYYCSEDGLVWTFELRDDVKFTDGEPLTAQDVAFTINSVAQGDTSEADLSMVDTAVATDDHVLEVRLSKPYNALLFTLAVLGIVPEHAYGEDYGSAPIGSGRYMLEQWDKGQQVIFEANPDYYGEKAKIKKVTVLFMDEDAALAAAMAGQVDVAHTAASLADEKIDGYGLLSVTSVDNRGINLPTVKASEKDGKTVGNDVTSDVAIRRAMNIGIDREEMIKNVLNGHGTAAYSVCDKMPWYNEESEVTYDQKSAKALLDEAGWKEGKDGIREKDGVRAEFTVMFNPDDSVRQALAEDFANQCKELGIEVKTEGAGWDVAYDKALSQPLVWGWGAHTPMELYNLYHTGTDSDSAEYSPYANETVDHYMDEALQADTLEDSYDLWKKAQWDGTTGVTQDGDIPWIWFCNVDHLYYVRDGLKVAEQKIHPHGHGWSIVNNVDQWEWSK